MRLRQRKSPSRGLGREGGSDQGKTLATQARHCSVAGRSACGDSRFGGQPRSGTFAGAAWDGRPPTTCRLRAAARQTKPPAGRSFNAHESHVCGMCAPTPESSPPWQCGVLRLWRLGVGGPTPFGPPHNRPRVFAGVTHGLMVNASDGRARARRTALSMAASATLARDMADPPADTCRSTSGVTPLPGRPVGSK
jgi:hypothetical protein